MRISLLIIVALAVVFLGGDLHLQAAVAPSETIRVAIVKNAGTVVVDGDGLLATRETGEAVALVPPVSITGGRDQLIVNGTAFRQLTFAASSAVKINGKPYRGMVEILPGEKGLLAVNQLPLEDYLVGLINCEISSAWPIEAVKAQAVIARTYALNRKAARKNAVYHLESSVMDQVYDGCLIEDSRARRAVEETAGEVLTYNKSIIQAFYHSSCGGKTEAAENVWGASVPYLKGVECEYCLTNPSTSWEQKLTLKDIDEKLRAAGYKVTGVTDLRPGPRNERGRLRNIRAVSGQGEVAISGDQFRKAIGYGIIKSTNFVVKVANGEAVFSGYGNGHGVGLCQWGAKQRALDGFGYAEILTYYYPGTQLKRFFEIS
ncbi:SpoIID/LytB domain-containing protein [Geobacter sp. SVR]|uniref:SpoIID/LytB domain-containing protein n=1 Tax=Geobacter sp. SVR TaxID=2495594 RepID=UPI00143EFEF6|nr:SpoIID/LytB domain-containing protein [Geobacter sp. SVR]BCS53781.1 cell division protein [Geobacter sp. SVR]GCF85710.1 cell division protein [Geobacter sp. SVR]